MIEIRRAKPYHIPDIHKLCNQYAYETVDKDCINNKDISIVALDDQTVIGFMWCGLMSNQKLGYISHFMVDAKYAKQGIGQLLYKRLYSVCKLKKVEKVFGIIAQDEYHDRAAMNALKMAGKGYATPYTYVYASLNELEKVLGV